MFTLQLIKEDCIPKAHLEEESCFNIKQAIVQGPNDALGYDIFSYCAIIVKVTFSQGCGYMRGSDTGLRQPP